jgi:hypothetical protein
MPGKRVQFDDATWAQIDLLARENGQPFQELAEEAFTDLLAKYDRSVDLKTQLLKSAGVKSPPRINGSRRSAAAIDRTGRRCCSGAQKPSRCPGTYAFAGFWKSKARLLRGYR